MFDRSAILRDAHRRTSWARARAAFPQSYRDTFGSCLREAWRAVKEQAAYDARMAALEAEEAAEAVALPADVARRISDLRMIAEAQTLTAYGSYRRELILAEADDIEKAARCTMIPAQDQYRHAH